jgi:hypothetical protein
MLFLLLLVLVVESPGIEYFIPPDKLLAATARTATKIFLSIKAAIFLHDRVSAYSEYLVLLNRWRRPVAETWHTQTATPVRPTR